MKHMVTTKPAGGNVGTCGAKEWEGNRMNKRGFNDPGDSMKGLTMPGKCESCNKAGARFRFENEYADQVIRMD